jgi:hypothetical protein
MIDVLVLLSDTTMYHLLGAGSLCVDSGPRDRHQRRSGSTTRPGFLTKLRAPKGNTSQCQPGGAQSRTSLLSSNGSGGIIAKNKELKIQFYTIFLYLLFLISISI